THSGHIGRSGFALPRDVHHQVATGAASAAADRAGELRAATHPVPRGQHRGSGGKRPASLTTAGGQDRAAGAGTHTVPEAVLTGPTPVIRLKSALAHGGTPRRSTIRTAAGKWECVMPSRPVVLPAPAATVDDG